MFVKSSVHAICFGILIIVIFGVFIHFSNYFDYKPASTDLAGWMNTAIYFNNVFSPILLLLSILLLYLTWNTSKKELQDSKYIFKKQLELQNSEKFSQNLTFLRQRYDEEYAGSWFVSRYTFAINEALKQTHPENLIAFTNNRNLGLDNSVNSFIKAKFKFYESRIQIISAPLMVKR